MESQKSQPLQARQAEAEMLLMTGGELQEMEQLAEDQKQSDLRGIEVWEWKMMKNGATAEQVEAERKRIDKETEDIIEG